MIGRGVYLGAGAGGGLELEEEGLTADPPKLMLMKPPDPGVLWKTSSLLSPPWPFVLCMAAAGDDQDKIAAAASSGRTPRGLRSR